MSKKNFNNSQTSNQFINRILSTLNFFIKILIQIGRKYLFIDILNRVKIYICFIILLSLIGSYFSLPNHYYFVQVKKSISINIF